MQQIGIDAVLGKINDTVDVEKSTVKTFGIRFLTEKNNLIGPRELTIRKRTKGYQQTTSGTDKRARGNYNLQANGLIAVIDVESNISKNVFVSMIYQFRDFESETWQTVFH